MTKRVSALLLLLPAERSESRSFLPFSFWPYNQDYYCCCIRERLRFLIAVCLREEEISFSSSLAREKNIRVNHCKIEIFVSQAGARQ